jgi:hypothetical protein
MENNGNIFLIGHAFYLGLKTLVRGGGRAVAVMLLINAGLTPYHARLYAESLI